MKRIILTLLLLCTLGMAKAQIELPSTFRWGFTGGINLSHTSYHPIPNTGFNVGTRLQYIFEELDGLYIESGIDLSMKGGERNTEYIMKTSHGTSERHFDGYENIRPFYLQVPIHVGYRYAFNPEWAIFGSVGSYLAVGLWGKYRTNIPDTPSCALFGAKDYRRMDIGLGGKIGVETQGRYQLSLSYDLGLIKLNTEGDAIRNRNASLSFTYFF